MLLVNPAPPHWRVTGPGQPRTATLRAGHRWVLQQFYSRSAMWRRVLGGLACLKPGTVLRGTGPLNLGYRSRLRVAGILAPAEDVPNEIGGRRWEAVQTTA
ncbi:MAG: hypothetical protein M5U12_16140 [Verrucomicrobia bacterium]|nr:hypothetical protein [Verrucomicrobiota bacterium]